jgi:hypothetical protein
MIAQNFVNFKPVKLSLVEDLSLVHLNFVGG